MFNPSHRMRFVSRGAFRDRWPLVVDSGVLLWIEGALVFSSGGVRYALDESARACGYRTIASICRADPFTPAQRAGLEQLIQIGTGLRR